MFLTLIMYFYYYNFYCNINWIGGSHRKEHNMYSDRHVITLFLLCYLHKGLMMNWLINLQHVACTSKRKYMLCLTKDLAFFLKQTINSQALKAHDRSQDSTVSKVTRLLAGQFRFVCYLHKGLMMNWLINLQHVACTSKRKYMLCLTKDLAFFLKQTINSQALKAHDRSQDSTVSKWLGYWLDNSGFYAGRCKRLCSSP